MNSEITPRNEFERSEKSVSFPPPLNIVIPSEARKLIALTSLFEHSGEPVNANNDIPGTEREPELVRELELSDETENPFFVIPVNMQPGKSFKIPGNVDLRYTLMQHYKRLHENLFINFRLQLVRTGR